MYTKVDDKGHNFQLFAEIQDHQKDGTDIPKEEGRIKAANGMGQDKITTRGWEVMVLWKDVSTDLIQLKDTKDSKQVKIAEYSVVNHIQDKTALAWWVSNALRWHNRIISKVSSKYWRTTHKFGI